MTASAAGHAYPYCLKQGRLVVISPRPGCWSQRTFRARRARVSRLRSCRRRYPPPLPGLHFRSSPQSESV